jgi:hypothetical protein
MRNIRMSLESRQVKSLLDVSIVENPSLHFICNQTAKLSTVSFLKRDLSFDRVPSEVRGA